MNQGFALPKEGWTYCPTCDADNMLTAEGGQQFDCPMCGLVLKATTMQGYLVALIAQPPLEFEALMRYQMYLAKQAQKRLEDQIAEMDTKMPQRVRLCYNLMNIIGLFFSCECRVIHDKKHKKEVNH